MDVYDLDGTIFAGNTFSAFTLWLLRAVITRGRPFDAVRLVGLVAHRKLRRITHHELKCRVVEIAQALPTESIERFVAVVSRNCTVRLAELRRLHGRSDTCLLATAAPDIYAVSLARRLGFDHVVASGLRGGAYVETIRECKRDEVMALVRKAGSKVDILFTDHVDDLSLARDAAIVVLVDGRADAAAAFEAQGSEVRRVNF